MALEFLVNPIGSGGDVYPLVALGIELKRRGHKVSVLTNPVFESDVSAAGLGFVQIGTEEGMRVTGSDPKLHRAGQAWKLALRWGAVGTMRETYNAIRDSVDSLSPQGKKPILLAPPLSLGARLAVEKFRLPWATTVLSPFLLRSVYDTPVMKPMWTGKWVPKWAKRMQYWFADQFVIDPVLKTEVNNFCKDIGLPQRSRFLGQAGFSKDLTLALFPKQFAPPQSDWPKNIETVNNVFWDPPKKVDDLVRFQEFLKSNVSNRKPVVLLSGSAGAESQEFYPAWIQATHRLGSQLIILERNPNVIHDKLKPHVFHSKFLPLERVLESASVIAHSGGVGATLRGMKAGVPQLLFPKVNDQPDNANRIKRLGLGRVIRRHGLDRDMLKNELALLLDDKFVGKCRLMSKSFSSVDPALKICDLIEEKFN